MSGLKNSVKLILSIILLCIPIFSIPVVRADSGWDSDYDLGSSWDSGDSWDYDGSDGTYSFSSFGDFIGFVIIFLIFMFILFIYTIFKEFIKFIKKIITGKDPNDNSEVFDNNSNDSSSFNTTIQNKNLLTDISAEKFNELLPGESINSLKNTIFDLFVDIQTAWMNFDYNKLRELCTDELYNSYVSQLEILKLKNGKNIMKNFVKYDIKFVELKKENENIELSVYLYVQFYDYVINQKTNSIIRGSNCVKVSNKYLMTFVKGNNAKKEKCPNCGADIKANVSDVCEYCNSTVVKNADNFVLSKKTNIN